MTPTDDGKPPEHLSGDEREMWKMATRRRLPDPSRVLSLLSEVSRLRREAHRATALDAMTWPDALAEDRRHASK